MRQRGLESGVPESGLPFYEHDTDVTISAHHQAGTSPGLAPLFSRLAAGVFALGLVALLPESLVPESLVQQGVRMGAEAMAQSATAQTTPRTIPLNTVLGTIAIGVFPQASLNGKAVSLGPGFRLYDSFNRIVVPSTVSGQTMVVAYRTGPIGEVTEAWQLSNAEFAARRRLSTSNQSTR